MVILPRLCSHSYSCSDTIIVMAGLHVKKNPLRLSIRLVPAELDTDGTRVEEDSDGDRTV
jgi:hypothetical protein